MSDGRPSRRVRAGRFGAIAQLGWPRALVFVDRAFARTLGVRGGTAWREPGDDGAVGGHPLSAPLEAHLQLTNRCDVGCQGCYTGATAEGGKHEWGATEW